MSAFDGQSELLAESWTRLIGIIVIFGFYVIGAITKALANRSGGADEDKEKASSYLLELAKKRAQDRAAAQKQAALQARLEKARNEMAGKHGPLTEWDRLQETKRRKQTQPSAWVEPPKHVQSQPLHKEMSIPPFKQARTYPDFVEVPSEQSDRPVSNQRQPVQQKYVNIQPPNVSSKIRRRHVLAPKPKKASAVVSQAAPMIRSLEVALRHPDDLRAAIILKEILDKPIALREEFGTF